jgi:hypothetical protein
MLCPKCGTESPDDSHFCRKCGNALTVSSTVATTTHAKAPRKGTAIGLFVLALIFWLATIINHTLGFIAPVSGEAVGFDAWTLTMWFLFLYAARNLYRSFRGKSGGAGLQP